MKKLLIITLILAILLSTNISAQRQGHIKLLAVSSEDDKEGSIADLSLELIEGSGRVFIDTIPLTKLDTQISTRFAKDIACDYAKENCNNYDFIYTIRADSPIIGGPSAGSAITILTISLLDNINIDENIAITGTINSGGYIGPVGGLKGKIKAASTNHITKVLIPKATANETELKEFGKENNIEVLEVEDIDDALWNFADIPKPKDITELQIDQNYKDTMKSLADTLCERTEKLKQTTNEISEFAINQTIKSKTAYQNGLYYSAASYCYGANIEYSRILTSNLSKAEINNQIETIEDSLNQLEKTIENYPKNTITDLETFIIVKERILEARELLNNTKSNIKNDLHFAKERAFSAISWSEFFNNPGKTLNINNQNLELACDKKIQEAEERQTYAELMFPETTDERDIENAKHDKKEKNFELCIFKASKAKAESSLILGLLGVSNDKIDSVIESRTNIAKKSLAKSIEKNTFPILGYSYYEYGNDLKEQDQSSTLLYMEYALELGNLDIYFNDIKQAQTTKSITLHPAIIFTIGLIVGLIIYHILTKNRAKKSNNL